VQVADSIIKEKTGPIVVSSLLVILYDREYRKGWRQQGGYVKLKLQKTASFIVVESLDVPPERTHILLAALILLKVSHGTLSLFNHVLLKFKEASIALPDFRVEADWLKCAMPQT
jgi:hypothetical protein